MCHEKSAYNHFQQPSFTLGALKICSDHLYLGRHMCYMYNNYI